MWMTNNDKAKSQTYLKYDMQNLMAQLNSAEQKIDGIIASIDRAVGGIPSGLGNTLTDGCREAKSSLEEARRLLNTCNDCVAKLDVMEWVSDDQYR